MNVPTPEMGMGQGLDNEHHEKIFPLRTDDLHHWIAVPIGVAVDHAALCDQWLSLSGMDI